MNLIEYQILPLKIGLKGDAFQILHFNNLTFFLADCILGHKKKWSALIYLLTFIYLKPLEQL